MTTFKGFLRSTNAAINRLEHARQQQLRRAAQIEKLRQKQAVLANAALAVQQYNELIALLTSLHKEAMEPMDWGSLFREPRPIQPEPNHALEQKASLKLSNYRPSFFDKLFGSIEKKRMTLRITIEIARAKDTELFENAQKAYQQALRDWEALHQMADGVLHKQVDSYRDAVARFNPFSEVTALGSSIHFTFQPDHCVVDLELQPKDILPKQVLSLTSTGKLSQKEMPLSRFNELYQDHLCSCLLRVAREVLALLQVDFVIVNVKGDLLDTATGHLVKQTLISAAVFPNTLEKLLFDTLDPSDAINNFKHAMQFSKTGGFRPVEPLNISDLSGSPRQPELVVPQTLDIHSAPVLLPASKATLSTLDEKILAICKEKGPLHAIKYYKEHSGVGLKEAKDYVEQLTTSRGINRQ